MGLPDGPSGHSQENSGIRKYLRRTEIQLMCRIPTWEWSVFGCQTVPIGCDKYVIRSVSLFVHMGAAAVDTLSAGEFTSTCTAYDFCLCNPSVSGGGGSGQGRPSGMPRKCTWITARAGAYREGCGGVLHIQIL